MAEVLAESPSTAPKTPGARRPKRSRRDGAALEVTIGTMIETPRAALRAADIAHEADFFSFGTNDLTQMTFGFSRDDVEGRMMSAYLELGLLDRNPFEVVDPEAVGELVRLGVARGRATRPELKIGVCGEHGGDPESIATFYSAGLDYVSCSPFRVPVARLAAAQAVLSSTPGPPGGGAPPAPARASMPTGGGAKGTGNGRAKATGDGRAAAAGDGPARARREAAAVPGDRLRGPRRRPSPGPVAEPPGSAISGHPRVTVRSMAIPDEDVAHVRAATDIVALIGEHVALKQQGRRWSGLCPFHSEKTPSFSVNSEMGVYYCFGCQASGDAISFVRATEHLSFVEAVRMLADRSGVVIHEDVEGGRQQKRRADLVEAVEAATAWYHERLLGAADAGPARDYLRSRGYDGTLVRQFRLGWAPDDWDALARALALPERVMSDAGLGFVNRRGSAQDAFRARVIFPICDPSGRPVALGGRILPGSRASVGAERVAEPKYKNSQETAIYSKRRTLYALNWAKHDIVASGEVVVCEGYTDVIGFFQAGLPRAVATCGTSLAEEHFTLLRNFARRIVLAYDADSAGQSATSRVYEWERRHEVDVVVAGLPPGTDPGELAHTDPEALREAVAEARPFLQFRVDRVFAGPICRRPRAGPTRPTHALAAVAEHPDDLVRDQYVMQIADRCRLEPTRVRERLERGPPATGTGGIPREPWPTGTECRHRHGRPRGTPTRPGPTRANVVTVGRRSPRVDRAGHLGGAAATADGGRSSRARGPALRRAPTRGRGRPFGRRALRRRRATSGLRRAGRGGRSGPGDGRTPRPRCATLLRRMSVEEPIISEDPLADPVDAVVTQLVREASRRALADLGAQPGRRAATWATSTAPRPVACGAGSRSWTIPTPVATPPTDC